MVINVKVSGHTRSVGAPLVGVQGRRFPRLPGEVDLQAGIEDA